MRHAYAVRSGSSIQILELAVKPIRLGTAVRTKWHGKMPLLLGTDPVPSLGRVLRERSSKLACVPLPVHLQHTGISHLQGVTRKWRTYSRAYLLYFSREIFN